MLRETMLRETVLSEKILRETILSGKILSETTGKKSRPEKGLSEAILREKVF